MPSLFSVSGYKVFFWSNENNEPIHVHICKGKLSPNATKVWLTKNGGCILANNGSHIPEKELRELMEFISAQRERASYAMLKETGEFVINLPDEPLVKA